MKQSYFLDLRKIFYAQNRRSGGKYLRRFLENEYKDRCFIGLPQSQADVDFILGDRCLCFCTHIQLGGLYDERTKEQFTKIFRQYSLNASYGITIIRHPVKRFYSGIQKQLSLLNNPANQNNHGRFSHLSRIYGSYTKNFLHKNLNPSDFNLAPLNVILSHILSKADSQLIEDTEETMWLYESLFTLSLNNLDQMKICMDSKQSILNTPISMLPNSIEKFVQKNFQLVGVQENNESYLQTLVSDGILSRGVVDEFRELFPKINTTVPIDEKIREEILYEWYINYPYDFALWSWAMKKSTT